MSSPAGRIVGPEDETAGPATLQNEDRAAAGMPMGSSKKYRLCVRPKPVYNPAVLRSVELIGPGPNPSMRKATVS
jgi:hypothetical protein